MKFWNWLINSIKNWLNGFWGWLDSFWNRLINGIGNWLNGFLDWLDSFWNWLNIPYGNLEKDRQKKHKDMLDYVFALYGFTLIFIFLESIKNILALKFSGSPIMNTTITPFGLVFLFGLAFFIGVHALALARLLVRLSCADLYGPYSKVLRFVYRNVFKLLAIAISHFYVLIFPFYYIETNRAEAAMTSIPYAPLKFVDLNMNYWNFAILDIFLLLTVAVVVVYIKKN